MKKMRQVHIVFFLLLQLFFWARPSLAAEYQNPFLPKGFVLKEGFQPGYGLSPGQVQNSVGRVVLIHADETFGYQAKKDLPVFMQDSVVTPLDGRALLLFKDESTVSVAAETRLVINRSVFDPDKLDRSTFLNMTTGKARFWIKKLIGFKRSEFKVKTRTLVAGVRGSDFVIEALPSSTVVIALDDTELELVSLSKPRKRITLKALEKIRIIEGEEPSAIERITPEAATRLKMELPMPFEREWMNAVFPVEPARQKQDAEVFAAGSGEAIMELPGVTVAEPGSPLLEVWDETLLLISETELVPPEPAVEFEMGKEATLLKIVGPDEMEESEEQVVDQQERIVREQSEALLEEMTLQPLPDFPGTP